METQDLRTLRILEAIHDREVLSQRDLSRDLNISLGLVNSFIKRLGRKGYFKITHLPKNRIAYILTPQGLAEKTRLTYDYVHYSISFYREARSKLKTLYKELENSGELRIVFCGLSDLTEIAFISLQETPLVLVGIIDQSKVDKLMFGRKIMSMDAVGDISFDRVLLTAYPMCMKLTNLLVSKGISKSKLLTL